VFNYSATNTTRATAIIMGPGYAQQKAILNEGLVLLDDDIIKSIAASQRQTQAFTRVAIIVTCTLSCVVIVLAGGKAPHSVESFFIIIIIIIIIFIIINHDVDAALAIQSMTSVHATITWHRGVVATPLIPEPALDASCISNPLRVIRTYLAGIASDHSARQARELFP
jgi:hypothetical protein